VHKFVRSTVLRAGIAQVGAGIVVLLLLAGGLWFLTIGRLDRELKELVQEDTRTVTQTAADYGLDIAAQTVERHVGPGLDEDELLLLADRNFHRLAGNLPAWPIDAPTQPGWATISIVRGGIIGRAQVLHSVLPGGVHLLSGRDLHTRSELEAEFQAGLAGAALMLITAGLYGAWSVRRRFVRRIEQLNVTTRAIVSGRLNERLVVKDERNELDLLSGTINRMLDQIEQLIGGVRNVSNAIAHDLRTPLGELRVRLESLLLDQRVTNGIADEVEGAIEDTDRLIATFNGLLRLAELDSGARRAGFVDVDAASVIAQAVDLYAPLAEAKSMTLAARHDMALPVDGDPVLLAQAVANLIDNALKYAPPGTEVAVTGTLHFNGRVELVVADRGRGIPPEERTCATERFFRGTSSAGTQGVGLGLSMVAAIARLHGGALRLEDNEPGLRAVLSILPRGPKSQTGT
jgi:hypothetical protein